MPIARFEMPDGRIARFEVPEGTSPEEAQAQIEAMVAQQAPQEAEKRPPIAPDQYDRPPTAMEETKAVASDVGRHGLNVLGELAASANRSVTEFLDFIGPDTANAILRLSGSKTQVPTLTGALEPTGIQGGFMAPGVARDAVQAGGHLMSAAAGMMPVARSAVKGGSAVLDVLGFGSTSPINAAGQVQNIPFRPLSQSKKMAQELALKRQTGDAITAGVRLDPKTGKVINDQVADAAIRQGFDEGFVAMIKSAPAKAREKMAAMVDIVEQGKKNFRYSADNRPIDITGKSILSRIKVVREANHIAGKRLNQVADDLKGQAVDVKPAVDSFLQDLDDIGVKFSPENGTVQFMGSDIEGVKGPQRVIKNILDRMRNTRSPDAYDVHRLKRFIDEQVTYGKNKRGLGGKTEFILKKLRREIDGLLDNQFPEYNKVNTEYAETIDALDSFQDVAGRKMDLFGENADSAIGTLSRRLLSNAQSRVPLRDSLTKLDGVAQKYATTGNEIIPHGAVIRRSGVSVKDLDDDVVGQVLFVDELEKLLGPSARTSLFGDVDKAINVAAGGKESMALEALKTGANKIRGVNEDNALRAIRELLKESQ